MACLGKLSYRCIDRSILTGLSIGQEMVRKKFFKVKENKYVVRVLYFDDLSENGHNFF